MILSRHVFSITDLIYLKVMSRHFWYHQQSTSYK